MKVAFVEFTPSGGLYQFSAQLADAVAAGAEVHFFTGADPELPARHPDHHVHPVLPTWHPGDLRPLSRRVRMVRRGLRAGRLVLAWAQVLVLLRRERPDAVVWSSWRFALDGVGVCVVRRLLPRAVLALIAHEPAARIRRAAAPAAIVARAWAALDVVFVLGRTGAAAVAAHRPVTGRVVTIPHGDESAVRGDAEVPACRDTAPVVLFFGGWSTYKGIDLLLDTVPAVREKIPEVRVVLAGDLLDAPATLPDRARGLGCEVRAGYVPRPEVADLFATARVVVVPYRRATQSGVVHLAYTFARPVVATAVGELPEVVADGRTGLLVAPDDPRALADGLVRLLADAELAQELGAGGAAWLEAECSWPAIGSQVSAALEAAATRRREPERGAPSVG